MSEINLSIIYILLCVPVALNYMSDERNAEKAFCKSIELNPDNPEALINLTILKVNQGQFREAKNHFYAFQEACLSVGTIDKEVPMLKINIIITKTNKNIIL